MKLNLLLAGAAFAVMSAAGAHAGTVVVTVDAKDDIFLAGQTSVPTDFPYNSGVAGQWAGPLTGAGLLPTTVAVHAGETLDITASGLASCCLGGSPTSGPNGGPAGFGAASISGYGKVGGYSGVAFPLVGVFGGPGLTGPWSVFVIGASDAGVVVPTGATTLYLGLPDSLGFGQQPGYYNDNTGGFSVSVAGVPEPATWAMMLVGAAGLGLALRSRRQVALARA